MVGANALLGHSLRGALVDLANECRTASPDWTEARRASLARYPGADPSDPLTAGADDPRGLAERGVLSRDGGHFHAVFASEDEAHAFATAAQALLGRLLPGGQWQVRVAPYGSGDDGRTEPAAVSSHMPVDLPLFQVCEESGNGPAVARGEGTDGRWHSAAVAARRRARDGQVGDAARPSDVLSLLRPALPPFADPRHFEDLCADDYLAVIHADGNGIGAEAHRLGQQTADAGDDPVARQLAVDAGIEAFFHRCRVLVRRAVVDALSATFALDPKLQPVPVRPYEILMLGGDDLLLVCRAKSALPFVVNYARALRELQKGQSEPMTVGCGVVIADHKVPFHHLHGVTEILADSAKRLARGRSNSTVDWVVSTASRADDPIARRSAEALVRYRGAGGEEALALSRRPLPILRQEGAPALSCLEDLVEAAQSLRRQRGLARSQLRALVGKLGRGRQLAELAFAELPKATREGLAGSGVDAVWRPAGSAGGRWTTGLADLVEVSEIQHLGGQRA